MRLQKKKDTSGKMSYISKDCGKCTRVIKNSKGYFCNALGRYIHNYQVTGEYELDPIYDKDGNKMKSGVVTNGYYSDHADPKCDFNPNGDYNPMDYVEPLECPGGNTGILR